jgi:methyl-accepting chemotaxis protein
MSTIRIGIGGTLLAISAAGMALLSSAAGYGLWRAWKGLQLAGGDTDPILLSLVMMGVAAAIAFIAFHAAVQRTIARPAATLIADLQRLAAGEFSPPVCQSAGHEFGQIAAGAERIRHELGRVIGDVQRSAGDVSAETGRLARSATSHSQNAQNQSGSASRILADVGQVAASINTITDNTETLRSHTAASLEQARAGNEKLSELVGEIDVAESAMQEIDASVAEFLQSTRSIVTMTQQVRDIADQTNLLALNAAIEAARAGEQGRGFAVVADEVRKLAEKSAQSASQIDEVTRALGERSEGVDRAIRKGQSSLRSSQEFVENVAIALGESNQMISQATADMDNIAVAMNEQNLATRNIARHIETIAQKAEEDRDIARESAEAVENLCSASARLEQSTNRFRV